MKRIFFYFFLLVISEVIMAEQVTFDYLKNRPELIETCARWSFDQWGKFTSDKTLQDYIASRKKYARYDDKIPLTIIAFMDNVPVGMCSLSQNRGICPDLTPWLATLYVDHLYQKRNIGTLLEQHMCEIARKLGYNKLYCFTSNKSAVPWYIKRGWGIRGKEIIHNHEVTVLHKNLQ